MGRDLGAQEMTVVVDQLSVAARLAPTALPLDASASELANHLDQKAAYIQACMSAIAYLDGYLNLRAAT